MKAIKAKPSKKSLKKTAIKVTKKDLEISISNKFMDVIKGLGHDAGKITKDIKKASKQLAKKLADKYKEVKGVLEDKLDKNSKAEAKAAIKAKKIIAKASKTLVKAKKEVAKASKVTVAPVKVVAKEIKSVKIPKAVLVNKPAKPAVKKVAKAAPASAQTTTAAKPPVQVKPVGVNPVKRVRKPAVPKKIETEVPAPVINGTETKSE